MKGRPRWRGRRWAQQDRWNVRRLLMRLRGAAGAAAGGIQGQEPHWGSLVARRGMYTQHTQFTCWVEHVKVRIVFPGTWSLSNGSSIEWWRGRSSNTFTMFRNERRQIFTRCAGVYFNSARPGGGVGCCWLYVQGSYCQSAQNAHERSTWVSLAVFDIPNKTVEKCKAHGDLNFGGSAQRLSQKSQVKGVEERGYVECGLGICDSEFRSKVPFFDMEAQRSEHPPVKQHRQLHGF